MLAVLATFVIYLAIGLVTGEPEAPPPDRDTARAAYRACVELVEEQLVSADGATFPELGQINISTRDGGVHIESYVDSFNGLDTLVRSNWSCTVEQTLRGWEGSAQITL